MGITLLTQDQIWGDKALGVMKKYGTATGMTDLAIAQGALMGSSSRTSDGLRSGVIWSASPNDFGGVRVVYYDGVRSYRDPNGRNAGLRPALPPSLTSLIRPSEARTTRKIGNINIAEFGSIHGVMAPENISQELGKTLSNNELIPTGVYTFDGEKIDAYDKPFKPMNCVSYSYGGQSYMPIEAKPFDGDSVFSDGHAPEKGEVCWMARQPIEWMKDRSGWWVALKGLLSGVQFDPKYPYDGEFEKTAMYKYLNTYFLHQCLPELAARMGQARGG